MTASRAKRVVTRLDLDPERLGYGLRTAVAACLAVVVAWLLGLEHPQWAGMTVWAASQPVRAHLVEKSLFRACGTVVGAIYGVLLAGLAARWGGPVVLVAGVALWLGLCAAAGNLLRGFASYGALLAGYSAAMVALLDAGRPETVVGLGLDRTATVLVGVAVALLVGLALTPRRAEADLPRRLRNATAELIRSIAARLRAPETPADPAVAARILRDLARLDDEIDGEGAGSLAGRRAARNRRRMLLAQVSAILWLQASPSVTADPGLADTLDTIADDFAAHAPISERRAGLARAARHASGELRRVLAGLGSALPRTAGETEPDRRAEPLLLHRDWIAAREAGVRSAGTILLIGLVWLLTGWSAGPMMMLGAAIMTSVFSTMDAPLTILPKSAMGQTMGVAAGLACRWLVWPYMQGETGLVLAMLPFILAGGVLTGHRKLQVQSFDCNMVMLLLLQPVWPLTGSLEQSLVMGLAVISGPLIAMLAFRFVHPPSAVRRRDALVRTLIGEVEAMAARPGARARAAIWRARLHHRLLRLVRWTDRAGLDTEAAAAGGIALVRLGQAVIGLEARLDDPALPPAARQEIVLALARSGRVGNDPERAADALEAVARLDDSPHRAGGALIVGAAEAVRAAAGFLSAAGVEAAGPRRSLSCRHRPER